jgi:hypothetical protein
LLRRRTAAISKGGLKDACDTHVTVAAPKRPSLRDVITYTPFDSIRSAFCLTFASTSTRLPRPLDARPDRPFRLLGSV